MRNILSAKFVILSKETALNESRRSAVKLIAFALITSILLCLPQSAAAQQRSINANQQIILKGAWIYPAPGVPPIKNGTVVIEDGRIAAIGSSDAVRFRVRDDAKVIDCQGKTVVAGFWNNHVHSRSQNGKTRAIFLLANYPANCRTC